MNKDLINTIDIDLLVDSIMNKNEIYKNLTVQKYYSLKWFINALKQDRFTFQKPSTWEDPFEDFISKLTNNHKRAIYNDFNITNDIYAMSTINKKNECDGMWSNFAQKNGVLVHIKVKNLIKSIVEFLIEKNCCSNNKVYINKYDIQNQISNNIKMIKIDYLTDEEIAKTFRTITKTGDMNVNYLSYRMLSLKRKEFEYENEYRFFINPKLLGLAKTTYLPIGFLNRTIEKVILSPRANDLRVSRLKNLLTNRYNINNNIIDKSNLYDINYFKKTYNL